ncbi:MAG: type II toxin-antitoxin system YafQ family toxin [Peptococcaceae bacterium]|nr:type II toxin-antitoxin system YafQ family toxin [Peptococcaceae bacterium]
MIIKYTVKLTTRFRKDYKLMEKRNLNMSLLDEIIAKLAQGISLPASNRDHSLTGDYSGHRECHITPDWLLIYRIEVDVLVLSLTRTGSHSDLF